SADRACRTVSTIAAILEPPLLLYALALATPPVELGEVNLPRLAGRQIRRQRVPYPVRVVRGHSRHFCAPRAAAAVVVAVPELPLRKGVKARVSVDACIGHAVECRQWNLRVFGSPAERWGVGYPLQSRTGDA